MVTNDAVQRRLKIFDVNSTQDLKAGQQDYLRSTGDLGDQHQLKYPYPMPTIRPDPTGTQVSSVPGIEKPAAPAPNPGQSNPTQGTTTPTTAAAGDIRQQVAAHRASLGLPPDPESDQIWVNRISAGAADMQTALDRISGKVPGQEDPAGFDFNPAYEAGMNQIGQMEAGLNSQSERQQRMLDEDYNRQLEDLKRQLGDARTASTEGMADRGLVHSGINIKQKQDIGEEAVRQQDVLGQQRARQIEEMQFEMAQQRHQLEMQKISLENQRAEQQAAADQERARIAAEAEANRPRPSQTGRYLIDNVQIDQAAMQRANAGGSSDNDLNRFADSPDAIYNRIAGIFDNRNVPIDSSVETAGERIARITQEVASGQRSFDDVRNSVNRLANQMIGR